MSAKLRRHSERGQRVDLFMTASAEDFPEGSKAALAHAREEARVRRGGCMGINP